MKGLKNIEMYENEVGMSNIDKARKFREEFDQPDVFGGNITLRQIWWIVKLCKTVRKFARSNAALYNLLNEIFRGIALFREVEKRKVDGTIYPGLKITMKDGTTVYDFDSEAVVVLDVLKQYIAFEEKE